MARIPESELERVKSDTDLVALIESSGVKLARQGANWSGLCPFHDDHDASLVVTPGKHLWHCLGACRIGGSAIDWVMRRDGLAFREAVLALQQRLGGPLAAADGSPEAEAEADCDSSRPPIVEPWMDDRELLEAVVAFYHATLREAPEALAYLERRGLGSPELVDHFRLGFANRSLGLRLPSKRTRAGAEIRERLQRLGLLRETSGHEHLVGRVVVPVFDASGAVVEIYGRVIRTNLRQGTPNHLYLPGPLRGVFNLAGLEGTKEVILCEALFDALSFWSAGFRNVTAAYGVEGLLADHLEVFERLGTERVYIAFDRDDAGDAGAAAVAAKLMARGIECFRVLFPRGMDANAYARRVQPPEKGLGLVLRSAQWLGKGKAAVWSAAALEELSEPATVLKTAEAAAPTEPAALLLAAASLDPPAAPAEPAPPAPATADLPIEVHGDDEAILWLGDRRYRVRGLAKNLSYELLKVNVLASRGERFHVDTLDLYSARQRLAFTKEASTELDLQEDVVRHDLGRVLLRLETLQDAAIRKSLAPATTTPEMTSEEREAALALLRSPELVARILEDFARCGVVGEETNKLVGYLAATSRKLDAPLAVLIQSSSAAGKSALMEAVLAMMPQEERIKYSAMTGQSLFYMSEQDLRHKILALVEEEGAERAAYALKLLQSEGELTIASTGKDPQSGKLVTHEYRVEGPVAILLTTTAISIDEELLNRCLVLTVDEDREQTRAIHRQQRERRTLDGYLRRRDRDAILTLHRNAQRLLRPLPVINPFAPRLTFLDNQTRSRRDHEKYLTLIETIALLHQHQRPAKTVQSPQGPVEYLEVEASDIALANRLAHEVLGRSLDELPPQTRRLLGLLDAMVAQACGELGIERYDFRFVLREVREWTGWGQTQLRLHLDRLVDLEYVVMHRGGRGQTFVYELVYDGAGSDGRPFLPKLIDVEALESGVYDVDLSGFAPHLSGLGLHLSAPSRPQIGVRSGGSRSLGMGDKPRISGLDHRRNGKAVENASPEGVRADASYAPTAS